MRLLQLRELHTGCQACKAMLRVSHSLRCMPCSGHIRDCCVGRGLTPAVLQMWGQLVRNAREWIRLTAVYFPKDLHPESLAYVQVLQLPANIKPASRPCIPNEPGCGRCVECACAEVLMRECDVSQS